jgi:L-idonate 5-dehydrogenase
VSGRRVLVTGSGPIGLLAVAAAIGSGAEVHATDVFAGPLERARALGATEAFDVTSQDVPADAYDVVLECSGVAASVSTALRAVRIGGTVVQVGMVPDEPRPINIAPFISKEVRWCGSFRFKDEIDEAIRRLEATPAIVDVIPHAFAADDAVAAFAAARDSDASGKVIVSVWPAQG